MTSPPRRSEPLGVEERADFILTQIVAYGKLGSGIGRKKVKEFIAEEIQQAESAAGERYRIALIAIWNEADDRKDISASQILDNICNKCERALQPPATKG